MLISRIVRQADALEQEYFQDQDGCWIRSGKTSSRRGIMADEWLQLVLPLDHGKWRTHIDVRFAMIAIRG